jgi:hypothetical protein
MPHMRSGAGSSKCGAPWRGTKELTLRLELHRHYTRKTDPEHMEYLERLRWAPSNMSGSKEAAASSVPVGLSGRRFLSSGGTRSLPAARTRAASGTGRPR